MSPVIMQSRLMHHVLFPPSLKILGQQIGKTMTHRHLHLVTKKIPKLGGNKAKEKACNGVMFGGAKGIPAGKM